MSDDIDRAQDSDAQDRDAQDRDRAIEAVRRRIAASHEPSDPSIDGICIDCDEPIEPKRLEVLARKTSRCASCAQDFEQRNRGFRR